MAAWTELPVRECSYWFDESGEYRAANRKLLADSVNRMIANMKKASESYSIRRPFTWSDESDGDKLWAIQDAVNRATVDYWWSIPQRVMAGTGPNAVNQALQFINNHSDKLRDNERSKPMGLTKEHVYKDTENDRTLRIEDSVSDPQAPYINVAGKGSGAGIWLDRADTIPLALNVLGFDRMGKLGGFETTVGGYVSHGVLVNSQEKRDQALAIAIANLKSIDRYDQRADERKAAEEAKKAHDAKLIADLESTKQKLRELSETVADFGVTAIRAEELAEAAAKYKAAFDAHAGV